MPKKKTTLDDILHATKHGFDAVDKRFDTVEKRLNKVESDIANLRTTVKMTYEVINKWPSPSEVDDLFYRVAYLEKHLGLTRRARKTT